VYLRDRAWFWEIYLPLTPPSRPVDSPPVSVREGNVRPSSAPVVDTKTHKERVKASLAWALEEYAVTLEKLAK
jgi:hypothetical protein